MIDLRLGDCLDLFPTLEPQSVDAIIADIPYGTTACKWDTVIPFEPMWAGIKRVIKPRGAAVLFGSQPFTSLLICSNLQWFRYEWVWDKYTPTGFMNARRTPLKQHENICVFSVNGHTYNPQKFKKPYRAFRTGDGFRKAGELTKSGVYGDSIKNGSGFRDAFSYPKSIIQFKTGNGWDKKNNVHPTQKPVALMEYLVRTYTNEGDTVLDFTMGSGTTMVACVNTNRNGIGWELDAGYFAEAQRRIAEAQRQTVMAL